MPTLDYAPTPPWHRRRRLRAWMLSLASIIAVGAIILAVRIYHRYEDAQLYAKRVENRRQEIFKQFDERISLAGKAVAVSDSDEALFYLADAEVVRDNEPELLTPKELADMNRRIGELRATVPATPVRATSEKGSAIRR